MKMKETLLEKKHQMISLSQHKRTKRVWTYKCLILLFCIMGIRVCLLTVVLNVIPTFKNMDSLKRRTSNELQLNYIEYLRAVLRRSGHELESHIPVISNKLSLEGVRSKHTLKNFYLPEQQRSFIKYAKFHNSKFFLNDENSKDVRSLNSLRIDTSKTAFVKEYIEKPFLIEGRKFVISVYVVFTSMNPLRAYWYTGDVSFKYCPSARHHCDPEIVDKYVHSGYCLPKFEIPSLGNTSMVHGMKNIFDIYLKSKGIDPSKIWFRLQNAMVELVHLNSYHIVQAFNEQEQNLYPTKQKELFHLTRFDFMLNQNTRVYLLGVTISPRLDTGCLDQNALLFEQMLYNLFFLTDMPWLMANSNDVVHTTSLYNLIVTSRNIAAFGSNCRSLCTNNCSATELCKLCNPCLNGVLKNNLLKAYSEFIHRGDFRRIFPPPKGDVSLANMSPMDRLQYRWFKAKCRFDGAWCI